VPNATNALDGCSIYYEDDGGSGAPVLLYGGILDTVELVRASQIGCVLTDFPDEFRLIYADHRGLGRSDKPHELGAYSMPLQVADTVAVLDELSLERAHIVGRSYGARLAFGIAEHAPERMFSIVAGGQQPYAMNPDGPLARVVLGALRATRRDGIRAFVEALEAYWDIRFPDEERRGYLAQDGEAVAAAAEAMLTQGAISDDLAKWRIPCLVYLGAADVDFVDQARRAADEIPDAEFVALDELDHIGSHYEAEQVIPAVLRTLRTSDQPPM
jgi:pimeloyl-ACP methyl ester carboxylesterase